MSSFTSLLKWQALSGMDFTITINYTLYMTDTSGLLSCNIRDKSESNALLVAMAMVDISDFMAEFFMSWFFKLSIQWHLNFHSVAQCHIVIQHFSLMLYSNTSAKCCIVKQHFSLMSQSDTALQSKAYSDAALQPQCCIVIQQFSPMPYSVAAIWPNDIL